MLRLFEFIANSGQWRVLEDGTIETCRDRPGRPTDPQVWRLATFLSPSRRALPVSACGVMASETMPIARYGV